VLNLAMHRSIATRFKAWSKTISIPMVVQVLTNDRREPKALEKVKEIAEG
jgi:hypothetical protein